MRKERQQESQLCTEEAKIILAFIFSVNEQHIIIKRFNCTSNLAYCPDPLSYCKALKAETDTESQNQILL